jgi:hypothetical protein
MTLGPARALFRVRALRRLGWFAAAAGFALGTAAAIWGLLVLIFTGGELAALFWTCVLGLAMGLGCAHFVLQYRRFASMRVTVHEGGLVVEEGGRVRTLPWDDVVTVWAGLLEPPRGEPPEVIVRRLRMRDGSSIELPEGLANAEALGRQVQEQTTSRLLADAESSLAAGRAVGFGAIAVDDQRMHVGLERLRWAELSRVQLSFRWIEVRHVEGGCLSIPAEEVPNALVLLALTQRRLLPPQS